MLNLIQIFSIGINITINNKRINITVKMSENKYRGTHKIDTVICMQDILLPGQT